MPTKTHFDRTAPAPRFARTQPLELRRIPWAVEPQHTPRADLAVFALCAFAALLWALGAFAG